jgi:SAM-dependent methyltransferase
LDSRRRPFYSEYAWSYDLLIDRPVRKECAAIAVWLVERGVHPGTRLLDAGCGTGRYAAELARRGYIVHGIDQSSDMIDVAVQFRRGQSFSVSFAVCDLADAAPEQYKAVLCRGVLNDFIEDEDRTAAFGGLARAIARPGVLIADVREWAASADRKAREPLFRKRVATERGALTFTSTTTLDAANKRLLVDETHTLIANGDERTTSFHFAMRCWTREELDSHLASWGFTGVTYFGAYDASVPAGDTDRLVVVAELADAAV